MLLLLLMRNFTPTHLARNSQWSQITGNFEMIHLKNLTAAHPRLQKMLLRIQGYDMTIKYKPGNEMLLADPMSSPLPSEESLNLQEVCLVQFSVARLYSLRQGTSSDLREAIYFGWPEKNTSSKPLEEVLAYITTQRSRLVTRTSKWKEMYTSQPSKLYIARLPIVRLDDTVLWLKILVQF